MHDMLGYGLGLRPPHFEEVRTEDARVDFYEIVSENFMVGGGKPRYYLRTIGERHPLVMHGVSLSIGGADPLDWEYLHRLRDLAREVRPAWISDHLCWTGVGGVQGHDLFPLPQTEEVVRHIAERLRIVQDFLGQRVLLENVSSYVTFPDSDLQEWEFLSAVVEEADAGILLDVNNLYVNAHNHGFDAHTYIDAIDAHRVGHVHLAGHSQSEGCLIDTHDHDVPDSVLGLYADVLRRMGPLPTSIERDDDIPSFRALEAELDTVRAVAAQALGDCRDRETA